MVNVLSYGDMLTDTVNANLDQLLKYARAKKANVVSNRGNISHNILGYHEHVSRMSSERLQHQTSTAFNLVTETKDVFVDHCAST
jgi:hypothetical protein